MKHHSKTNGSKVARALMPSEVEAETLRQIAGGPDSLPPGDGGHEVDPLEPNAMLTSSSLFSVGIALSPKIRAWSTRRLLS